MVEKEPLFGGTTAYSAGVLWMNGPQRSSMRRAALATAEPERSPDAVLSAAHLSCAAEETKIVGALRLEDRIAPHEIIEQLRAELRPVLMAAVHRSRRRCL